jgi:hypothetical protein
MVDLVTDPAIIREMKLAIWRDQARKVGVPESRIEHMVFYRWLLEKRKRVRGPWREDIGAHSGSDLTSGE